MGGFGKFAKNIADPGHFIFDDVPDLDPAAYRNPYSHNFISADARNAAAFSNPAAYQQSIAGYNPMIGRLEKQTLGIGPSLVQGQLQQGTNRNLGQALGFAAANRGVNPQLAQRMAGQNLAQINQQAAFDASQARMAEQLAAYQNLLAARNAKLSGVLGGAQLGANYRQMAEDQAERDRQARIGFTTGTRGASESDLARRQGFVSKAGQAVASLYTGGAAGAAGAVAKPNSKLGSFESNPNEAHT